MGLKAEHTDATRRELLGAARRLFSDRGFGATSTRDIAEEARVTKGALYHHFGDKVGIFRAVYETVEKELADAIVAAASDQTSPLAQLTKGAHAYLDACLDQSVRRIVLLDGPSVLGWEQWREIDARHALGLISAGLAAAESAGELVVENTATLAHVLLGALNEAGMVIAHSDDASAARRDVGRTVDGLLASLASRSAGTQ